MFVPAPARWGQPVRAKDLKQADVSCSIATLNTTSMGRRMQPSSTLGRARPLLVPTWKTQHSTPRTLTAARVTPYPRQSTSQCVACSVAQRYATKVSRQAQQHLHPSVVTLQAAIRLTLKTLLRKVKTYRDEDAATGQHY